MIILGLCVFLHLSRQPLTTILVQYKIGRRWLHFHCTQIPTSWIVWQLYNYIVTNGDHEVQLINSYRLSIIIEGKTWAGSASGRLKQGLNQGYYRLAKINLRKATVRVLKSHFFYNFAVAILYACTMTLKEIIQGKSEVVTVGYRAAHKFITQKLVKELLPPV